ncbi:MAG TPA: hypothetical protein VM869_21205 [Enhygromyxa sp.]|nr:hypothetical protein [Enhygromyxa sp.]
MSEAERERLRERVASGAATGEERDRLAGMLARTIRERDDHELEAIDDLIDELRTLADAGSDRSSCTDALAGALLDAQIRAFERADAVDAWRRLDEIRARLLHGGTPDLLHDRLAAALYNAYRGGELLADEPMRLAALEELRTRAYCDPSAAACRVALAELLADAVSVASRRADLERVELYVAELERLSERDGGLAIARELGRALRELGSSGARELEQTLQRVRVLGERFELSFGDPLQLRLAELLTLAHADALRRDRDPEAERMREQLRTLAQPDATSRPRRATALLRELGKALHDAAVLATDALALTELRSLTQQQPDDAELRGQLMSALFQLHRGAIEREDAATAEQLQAEADALLSADDAADELADTAERPPPGLLRAVSRQADRGRRVRLELRLDYLRILLATHAIAGDRGDWARAELLLARARELLARSGAPIEMLEVFGQLLVNAHVDAGAQTSEQAIGEQPLRARTLLLELRELARKNPHSATLQLHLATALFNAHVEAGRSEASAQADRLLDELDRLYRSHPGLLEVRRRLAMALVNHHGDFLERGNFTRASQLLEQLRELVRAPDADNHLRVQLAMALGNTLARVDDPACEEDDERIVSELRVLASREDASETLRALVLDELSDRFAPRQ